MSSGRNKQKDREIDAKVDKSIAEVKTVSPFQQSIDAQTKRVLDWENGEGEFAGKAKNYMDLPGMDASLNLYENAQDLADQERYGQGAAAFADVTGGAYGNQMKQQKDFQIYQNRAEGLSNAANAVRAQAHGQADNSIDRDISRKLNVANLESQNQTAYYNRPRDVPWWQQAIGIAGTAAGAASGLGWAPLAAKTATSV